MKVILSKCGNNCNLCPAHQNNIDKYDKREISAGWLKYHGFQKPENQIGCVGCLNNGKQDRDNCPIRNCCDNNGLKNCGYCREMLINGKFCHILQNDIEVIEDALTRNKDIPEKDYDIFFKPYLITPVLLEIYNDNFGK
jgi:hypothetical protein